MYWLVVAVVGSLIGLCCGGVAYAEWHDPLATWVISVLGALVGALLAAIINRR